jgi:hypothetical protein
MEWWILVSVAVVMLVVGGLSRVRQSRRRQPEDQSKNIYPLW